MANDVLDFMGHAEGFIGSSLGSSVPFEYRENSFASHFRICAVVLQDQMEYTGRSEIRERNCPRSAHFIAGVPNPTEEAGCRGKNLGSLISSFALFRRIE